MMTKSIYEANRSTAIQTLQPVVRTFANALNRRKDYPANADTAEILAAYTPAIALLLQLLREEQEENRKNSSE